MTESAEQLLPPRAEELIQTLQLQLTELQKKYGVRTLGRLVKIT